MVSTASPRQSLLGALNGMHDLNAGGMFGKTDLRGATGHGLFRSPPGATRPVRGRVYPKKVGTMSCAPKNLRDVKLDIS